MTRSIAASIRRKEWERVALLLLIGVAEAARKAPPGTIDDVLAMLSLEDDGGLGEPQITQISQMGDEGKPPRAQRASRKRPGRRRR